MPKKNKRKLGETGAPEAASVRQVIRSDEQAPPPGAGASDGSKWLTAAGIAFLLGIFTAIVPLIAANQNETAVAATELNGLAATVVHATVVNGNQIALVGLTGLLFTFFGFVIVNLARSIGRSSQIATSRAARASLGLLFLTSAYTWVASVASLVAFLTFYGL